MTPFLHASALIFSAVRRRVLHPDEKNAISHRGRAFEADASIVASCCWPLTPNS
jgi:hypothetical protein